MSNYFHPKADDIVCLPKLGYHKVSDLESELARLRRIVEAAEEMRIYITGEGAISGKFYSREKTIAAYDAAKAQATTLKPGHDHDDRDPYMPVQQ